MWAFLSLVAATTLISALVPSAQPLYSSCQISKFHWPVKHLSTWARATHDVIRNSEYIKDIQIKPTTEQVGHKYIHIGKQSKIYNSQSTEILEKSHLPLVKSKTSHHPFIFKTEFDLFMNSAVYNKKRPDLNTQEMHPVLYSPEIRGLCLYTEVHCIVPHGVSKSEVSSSFSRYFSSSWSESLKPFKSFPLAKQ